MRFLIFSNCWFAILRIRYHISNMLVSLWTWLPVTVTVDVDVSEFRVCFQPRLHGFTRSCKVDTFRCFQRIFRLNYSILYFTSLNPLKRVRAGHDTLSHSHRSGIRHEFAATAVLPDGFALRNYWLLQLALDSAVFVSLPNCAWLAELIQSAVVQLCLLSSNFFLSVSLHVDCQSLKLGYSSDSVNFRSETKRWTEMRCEVASWLSHWLWNKNLVDKASRHWPAEKINLATPMQPILITVVRCSKMQRKLQRQITVINCTLYIQLI